MKYNQTKTSPCQSLCDLFPVGGGALQVYCSEIRTRREQNLYLSYGKGFHSHSMNGKMPVCLSASLPACLPACSAFHEHFSVGRIPSLQGVPVTSVDKIQLQNS